MHGPPGSEGTNPQVQHHHNRNDDGGDFEYFLLAGSQIMACLIITFNDIHIRYLFTHELDDDLPVPGAVIKVYEDDLLVLPKG
jgi:hypothetical protein